MLPFPFRASANGFSNEILITLARLAEKIKRRKRQNNKCIVSLSKAAIWNGSYHWNYEWDRKSSFFRFKSMKISFQSQRLRLFKWISGYVFFTHLIAFALALSHLHADEVLLLLLTHYAFISWFNILWLQLLLI